MRVSETKEKTWSLSACKNFEVWLHDDLIIRVFDVIERSDIWMLVALWYKRFSLVLRTFLPKTRLLAQCATLIHHSPPNIHLFQNNCIALEVQSRFSFCLRIITSPMEPHQSYKRGFIAAALAMAFVACIQIPQYMAITSVDGGRLCVVSYKDLTWITKKLYTLSLDEELGVYTDKWNEILFNVPKFVIGLFLPLFLTGFFNHKATKGLNETLKAVGEISSPSKRKVSSKDESNANRFLIRRQKENRKVTKLMVSITTFTAVTFLPFWISCFIWPVAPKLLLRYPIKFMEVQTCLKYLWLLHSLASPLFYAGMHRKVRNIFKQSCQRRRGSTST